MNFDKIINEILNGPQSDSNMSSVMNTTTAEKNLQKFKKDFEKLLSKYPGVFVGGDINGNLLAYQQSGWKTEQINLPSYFQKKD
jgi:hypothetical protein